MSAFIRRAVTRGAGIALAAAFMGCSSGEPVGEGPFATTAGVTRGELSPAGAGGRMPAGRNGRDPREARLTDRDATRTVPLTDGDGLYGSGSNVAPAVHDEAGLRAARSVRPVQGRVVFASVGMSNTAQEWRAFTRRAKGSTSVVMVPTACAGCAVRAWDHPTAEGWKNADRRLQLQGLTGADVQVVWMNVTGTKFDPPAVEDFERILASMRLRWPNVRQLFVSSRIYGGYNPDGEPAAHEAGVVTREFVLRHLGETGPWVGWGPYLWADGATPRSDGLVWLPEDFEPDMIHPSAAGEEKVGEMLDSYFSTSPYSPWFRDSEPGTVGRSPR